ncbi:hypothetical protein Tco_0809522 [Tanacetum coccineum]
MVSLGRLRSDVVSRVLMPSHANPDGVTRNPDAVSTVCKKFFKPLRVKLQSCPVSFKIEPKSRGLNDPEKVYKITPHQQARTSKGQSRF